MLERIQRVLVIFQVALKQKLSVLRRYETPSYYDVVSFKECNSAQSYGIFFFKILTSNQSQLLGPFPIELGKKHTELYRKGLRSCDWTSSKNSNNVRDNV